jgi:hypothetical protein
VTIEEAIVEKLRALPRDKQEEVLDFVEFLHQKDMLARGVGRSLKGIWSDLEIDISEEEIRQARREIWGSFPRTEP